jgi:hypothetical protein
MSIPPDKWVFAQNHQRLLEAKECMAGRYVEGACAGKIIRAHVIPRSQLQQIAVNGHVHAVPTKLTAVMRMKELFFETKDIGVGEFSVLQCFCARHDNALFAPLENEALTFSPEQITLLHYRAIAAEAYQQGNRKMQLPPRHESIHPTTHERVCSSRFFKCTRSRLKRQKMH